MSIIYKQKKRDKCFLFVEVPKADDYTIMIDTYHGSDFLRILRLMYWENGGPWQAICQLESHNYKILATGLDMSEEQWQKVMFNIVYPGWWCLFYYSFKFFRSATSAGLSRIKSLGLTPDTCLIIECVGDAIY